MTKVVILGGGVAGMSAAHELINRGFTVEVFDRNPHYVGGKARSVNVQGTNLIDKDKFLPGEHGFRFFPGFYKHITDTMKGIPVGDGRSAFDNLVSTQNVMIAQSGKLPLIMPVNFPTSLTDITELFYSFLVADSELTKAEVEYFAERVWQLMTSCSERFADEYESISWWEYTNAANFSDAYQRLLVEGLTRSLVACKAQNASTNTVGTIFLQLLYLMIDRKAQDTDRVLNAPTNDAWLYPWSDYLTSKGVVYHKGANVVSIQTADGKISSATIEQVGAPAAFEVTGDFFILAVPVERAATLMNADILQLDPSLQNIIRLAPNVEWMNGVQFYLNTELNLNFGHTIYSNSNWALTSISQVQFWPNYDLKNRGNGKVVSILSVDISDWTTPGNFNGKAAQDCEPDEIIEEVLAQLMDELNLNGHVILSKEMIEFTYLDMDIRPISNPVNALMKTKLTSDETDALQKVTNLEPLLVNQCDTWELRPNSYTKIPNLYLASDYVKTNTNLATMEGANEAARRAVNNILKDTDSSASLCEIWELHNPLLLQPMQAIDHSRFKKGLKWAPIF